MIRYLLHHEIDKNKWDQCVDQAHYSIIYGYSWYLDVISPGWTALVEDDYTAIFPITWKKKFTRYYITQPVFAQQLGVFSRRKLSESELNDFLNSIPEKFVHFNITLNPSNTCSANSKYNFQPRKTYHVPLKSSYDLAFQKYSFDTQKNIRKSLKNNLVLTEIDVREVIELYKQNVWHKTPLLTLKNYETLYTLCQQVSLHKQCIAIGAFENEVLSAGTIFFISGDKIIFIFGSSNKTGRKNGAMRFIFDWVIRTNCNNNIVLDFEGSSIATVEYLYKNFGSDKVSFSNIIHYKSSFIKHLVGLKQTITKSIAVKKIKKYNHRATNQLV
jgi:hypothetical protein